jgi:DNA invertase Pin-like site-specific DNA recombinase
MKKYIYTRISSSSSDFDNQIGLMQKKWGPDLPVIEETKSGRKKRPKLMHLLFNTMQTGDILYVAHSDRLTRTGIGDRFMITGYARKKGLQIISLHEGDLIKESPTPREEMMEALSAWVAAEEAEATSRRIKDMFERRTREGKLSGVYLAIARGTHHHGHKKLNPVIQSAIPRMVELRKEGHGYRKIAEMLSLEFPHKFNHAYVHELITRQAS